MSQSINVIYKEVQRPKSLWFWGITLVITVIMWYGFIQQVIFGIPVGDNPAPNLVMIIFWVLFGIIFPGALLIYFKLIVEVREDGVYIKVAPFHRKFRRFLFSEIIHYEFITYNTYKRFGGWGIRINLKNETAYNIGGNKGLELRLNNKTVVIGTTNPSELERAMHATSFKIT